MDSCIAPHLNRIVGEPYLCAARADEAQNEHDGLGLLVFIATNPA